MRTAIDKIGRGKERDVNVRFQAMATLAPALEQIRHAISCAVAFAEQVTHRGESMLLGSLRYDKVDSFYNRPECM